MKDTYKIGLKRLETIVEYVSTFRVKNIRKIFSIMRQALEGGCTKNMLLVKYGLTTHEFSTAYVLNQSQSQS